MPDSLDQPDRHDLPDFATRAGVSGGDGMRLLVDPTDAAGVDESDRVVLTSGEPAAVLGAGEGVVYSPVEETVAQGRPWRAVATAAVCDLGGVVAEIVRLDPGEHRLVVFARAVDERGAPRAGEPAVLYVGDLLTDPADPRGSGLGTDPEAADVPAATSPTASPVPDAQPARGPDPADHPHWRRAQILDLALGMLGVGDVVVAAGGRIAARSDMEDLRARIQQRVFEAPTLAEQAQRQLPLI